MDEDGSYITTALRKLEKYVRTLPVMRQATSLGKEERERLLTLEDRVGEARKLANDAALSDDITIKLASFEHCIEELEAFRQALLTASQSDLVDAADVAQLSAMADQVGDLVKRRIAAELR